MFRSFRVLPLFLIVVVAGAYGCGAKKVQESPSPQGVSAPGLGITLASVPSVFKVRSSGNDRIVLVPADPKLGGSIEITAASPEAGLNLQEAVKRHRQEIEERPGGKYLGAQELAGPLGTAYWSRGRYETDGGETEETRIVTLDPSQQRILRLTYAYPAGEDSKERVTTLLDVTAELEPFQPPASE